MQVELYRDWPPPILGEWDDLFSADPEATPFASPAWAEAWWPHWAEGAQPWVLTVRSDGALVALAPLVLRRRGPFRVLGELGRHPSNYWDVVALPEHREEAARAIAAELAERRTEWDALVLASLPETSATIAGLEGSPLHVHMRPRISYPGIELPSGFDEYLASLPAKRRKDIRRHLRRVDSGEVEVRPVGDPERLEAIVDRWQELRVSWWRARGRAINPEHASARFREFLADLLPRLVPAGLAEVWELIAGGELVGVEISLVDERRFYAWLDGYDPDSATLGLGKIAVAHGIRASVDAGRSYFDFMVGEESYKYWYGAEDRYCRWLMCTSVRPRSRAARGANALVERLRRD